MGKSATLRCVYDSNGKIELCVCFSLRHLWTPADKINSVDRD